MKDLLQYIALFFSMILIQVLICNNIIIFNAAVPVVFIYFLIRIPIQINMSLLYSIAFLLGLSVDIFSDTLGVNALACTILAAIKKPVMYAYVQRDDRTKNVIPTINTLGIQAYAKFLFTIVAIYCLLIFSIEYFNFANIKDIIIMTASSSLLTFAILLGIDSLIFETPFHKK